MLRVVACLTQEHDVRLTLVAAVVCVIGSILTVRLFMLARKANKTARRFQIGLTAIVAGGMIWATHFIAMLAYDPGVDHGYEPVMTGVSLLVVVIGTTLSMGVATTFAHRHAMELGGIVFGMSVAAMHYLGMSAFLIVGNIYWNPTLVVGSIVLGSAFGALTFQRIGRPVTRYCWLGGAIAMVLSITSMHFTGMAAITIELNPTVIIPPNPLSENALAMLVLAIIVIVQIMGLAAFMIEARLIREARNQLQAATLSDPLTGLPNRLHMQTFLNTIVNGNTLQGKKVAILTIDLDMFKQINETHGHHAGDAVLKTIAGRMRSILTRDEFVARTGGDEFIVIKSNFASEIEVTNLAQRLQAQVMLPIIHEDLCMQLGVSIGIASTADERYDIARIQEYSDIAMDRAKADNNTAICRFESHMFEKERARRALRADLRVALAQHQFELHYQQQNNIKTHDIVGFEALLRWTHPQHGNIRPDHFIPIAEETGLIRDIGLWVMRTACLEAASWSAPYTIAVNVAPQQLIQTDFVEEVADILMESGLAAERLELEVTEASIIDDYTNTRAVMHVSLGT